MKSKIKKVISGTVSALMIASSIPSVASAADQQTRGNIGGYDYEMWNQNGQGNAQMNPSAGSFTCSWSNIENFLARMGKNFDSQKKNYKALGDIVLTYDVEYTPRGNSYMCVYGWTRNPLMEYYIVEGWGDWRPPGNDGENKGSVTLNGNKYDIRKSMRYNQPSLDGTATFPQYWSVRQTSGSANNQTNYMKGTIDVSKHFDAWSQAGLDMSGTLYEVSLNIEGYRSNGSANVKSVTVVTDGSGAGASSTSEAGGGNVGGGFDMGGGQGGFDMSQFGGGNGGGFDMSQFGGQGGFDMGGSTGGGSVVTTTTTTTKPVTTTTTTVTTIKQADPKEELNAKVSKWGDANGDGTIDMGDAVAILQALANPNKYKLSDQGAANADVYEAGSGLTANDANSIQLYLLGLIKTLPESYASNVTATTKATTTTTTTKATTTTTTTAVNNGGQQGGFDMSQFGGQGGFDMSQFGGQQGGFDMSQFGGQQGGFDMSQFGGQQGGFDMSQFGGQQGGFDMSQFGGQQGGFDMSQFGGQQGGFDMSQFGGQQDAGQQTGGNGGAQVQSGKKLCAISFDDGASAQSKSDPGYRIIDALIKNNMTATFFIVGDWIKTNDQIKYEYQNGMEVANHTQSHPHLGSMGASQIRSEWENCNSKLKGIIGTEPSHLMRLPYLESNATVQSALNDVPLISCAIDTQDWNNASKDQIVNTIKQAAQNGSLEGAIVLCHENYATTAAAMEEVLPWLAQNGYQNVNISDMAKAHGKTLAGGQVHTRA